MTANDWYAMKKEIRPAARKIIERAFRVIPNSFVNFENTNDNKMIDRYCQTDLVVDVGEDIRPGAERPGQETRLLSRAGSRVGIQWKMASYQNWHDGEFHSIAFQQSMPLKCMAHYAAWFYEGENPHEVAGYIILNWASVQTDWKKKLNDHDPSWEMLAGRNEGKSKFFFVDIRDIFEYQRDYVVDWDLRIFRSLPKSGWLWNEPVCPRK